MKYSGNFCKKSTIILLLLTVYMSILSASNLIDLLVVENLKFYILLLLAFINWRETRQLTLFQVWIAGYIFIIQSDIMITLQNLHSVDEAVSNAINFLSIANGIVLLGYSLRSGSLAVGVNEQMKQRDIQIKKEFLFVVLIIFFSLLYIVERSQQAFEAFMLGRQLVDAKGSGNFYDYFISAIGGIMPCFISFYFYRIKHWKSAAVLVLCIPFFLISFMSGTRFKLLFIVLPPLIIVEWININNLYGRRLVYIVFLAIVLIISSSVIKEYRLSSLMDGKEYKITKTINDPLLVNLSKNMSPEGIVNMIKLQDEWFSCHPHSYGRESAVLLYFWIPRSFWNNKPLQLDYWLIRKFERVSDAHSTASGFAGELKADFGLFSLVVLFLFGAFIRYLDSYVHKVLYYNNSDVVFVSLMIPFVFFWVRSPVTAFINMIFQIIIFYVVKKYFLSENK